VSQESPHFSQDPDTQLMMRFAAGDDRAFDRIVESFQRQVFGVIHRYLGGAPNVDDVSQEVFIRLYKMRKSYKPTAKLSTLVYRIAANLCTNVIRDEGRRRGVPLDAAYGDDDAPLSSSISDDTAAPPDQTIEERERAQIVRNALSKIPDRQRMALVLHRFEGLSYLEIAEALETNVDAVKSLLSRARQSLADELQKDIDAGNL
jgi:RNA polymerase sigma-70 factor, ECF subfamily